MFVEELNGMITAQCGGNLLELSVADRGRPVRLSIDGGRNMLGDPQDLWQIAGLSGNEIRPTAADEFSWQATDGRLSLVWQFTGERLQVCVDIDSAPGGCGFILNWRAGADASSMLAASDVHFPCLSAAESLEQVTAPAIVDSEGVPLENAFPSADTRLGGLYPSGTSAIQCFASWGGGSDGLYVGAHDPAGYTKTLKWTARQVDFIYHVTDPDVPRKSLEIPYPTVLAAFHGDWRGGIDIYRDWARAEAPWCNRGTLAEMCPEWAKRSAAWLYSVHDVPLTYKEMAPRLREVFGLEGPVGIHALGAQVQDHSNMPQGEPPQWMREARVRQTRELREQDYYVFEYRNSHKYTAGFTGIESALPYASRFEGKIRDEGPYAGGAGFKAGYVPVGTPNSRTVGVGEDAFGVNNEREDYLLTEMCMGTDWWQDRLLSTVAPLTSYGILGVYMDQLPHNLNDSRCDAVHHGHPLRGGDWYVKAHEEALRQVRRHFVVNGVPKPLISHEYIFEAMVGLVTAALLDWDMTIFSYLYHPFVLFESHNTYNGVTDIATLRENLAHDFHSGRVPSLDVPCSLPGVEDVRAVLADNTNPADEPAFRMIRRWLRTRSAWLEYLNLGDMLIPPTPLPGNDGLLFSKWRSPDGCTALFVSNVSDTEQAGSLDMASHEIPQEAEMWLNDKERADVRRKDGIVDLRLSPDDTFISEHGITNKTI